MGLQEKYKNRRPSDDSKKQIENKRSNQQFYEQVLYITTSAKSHCCNFDSLRDVKSTELPVRTFKVTSMAHINTAVATAVKDLKVAQGDRNSCSRR